MNSEQRANIKFCFQLGKTATETHHMMLKVYGDKRSSPPTIYEIRDWERFVRSLFHTNWLMTKNLLRIKSTHSPDLAQWDFYLFKTLHLTAKGKRHADIKGIQKSMTVIPNIISTDEIKMSFNSLLDPTPRCIESKGCYFEGNKTTFPKKN